MPLTNTRQFRVRQYECDAHNHLTNANYLRFMQETAFDASAAAGYDHQRYREMNHLWLIRESEIDYLTPVKYNAVVAVKTWVADFRRATSRRMYEFYNQANGKLVARASTLWVYIETTGGLPAAIPQEMVLAFVPEATSNPHFTHHGKRKPYPKPPTPPQNLYTITHKVIFEDLDQMEHVNNANYLQLVEACREQALVANNQSMPRMSETEYLIRVHRYHVHYRKPAVLDDELRISTWVYNVDGASCSRYYQMRRGSDCELLAQVHAKEEWIDPQSGNPVNVPEEFLHDLSENISPSLPETGKERS